MELADAVRARRMVRSFSGVPPAAPVLERILAGALRSPSAGNTGGWDAVVLQGTETDAFWSATTTPEWRQRSRRWPGLSRAPVVVSLFCHQAAYLDRYSDTDKRSSGLGAVEAWPVPYWFVDAGFAALILLLGAVDAGLGACFLGNFRGEAALCEALGVPDGRRYVGAVLLGEAGAEEPPSTSSARGPRTAAALHRGRFGQSFVVSGGP